MNGMHNAEVSNISASLNRNEEAKVEWIALSLVNLKVSCQW